MRPGLSFCSPRPWPELRCRARRSLGGNPGTSSPISPRPRGGWSADRALFCFVARARRDLRALRRGLSRSERDLSRRSTMAIFGRGPMPPPPGVQRPEPSATCPQATRAGGGIPDLPRQRFAPQPGDATPRSAFRIVSGDAPHERGCESITQLRCVVNIYLRSVVVRVPQSYACPNLSNRCRFDHRPPRT